MAIRKSDDHYKRLLTAVSTHSYTVYLENGEATATEHDQGCLEVTGYSPEEYENNPYLWISMIYEEDRERVLEHIGKVLQGQFVPPIEHRIIHKDGSIRWVRNTMVPTVDENGEVNRYDGVVEDITERREYEENLQESLAHLQIVADYSSDWIYWLDASDNLRYISPACEEISGYGPDEFRADPELLRKIIHPEDRELWEDRHRLESYEGGAPSSRELRMIRKDGTIGWILHICRPIYDSHNIFSGFRGTIHDITERLQSQEAAIRASRMETATVLAGGIAHDFNNMMMSVMGYCELLKMEIDDPDSLEMLKEIVRVADRAGELSQQMLAFARGGKYQSKSISINTIINQTLSGRMGVDVDQVFTLDLDSNLELIEGDPSQVGQVIWQLIQNALEAIDDDGKIRVTTRNYNVDAEFARKREGLAEGPAVMLRIEDNGRGMTDDVQSRVFEPFFTTKFQGRGMGLAAAYGIIKNHQGDITVESVPGEGSVFTVYLPVQEAVEKKRPASAPPAIPTGKESLLVVNEDETLRTVTQKLLERLGYRVWTSRNNQTAVNFIMTCGDDPNIKLILMDMMSPTPSIREAIRLIKRSRPDVKILFSFAGDRESDIREMLDAGGDSFLRKPYHLDVLGHKVREVLER
ncbi:MAG: PAS domain-containing protein [Candidatus Sumerlaeia bacterium]